MRARHSPLHEELHPAGDLRGLNGQWNEVFSRVCAKAVRANAALGERRYYRLSEFGLFKEFLRNYAVFLRFRCLDWKVARLKFPRHIGQGCKLHVLSFCDICQKPFDVREVSDILGVVRQNYRKLAES